MEYRSRGFAERAATAINICSVYDAVLFSLSALLFRGNAITLIGYSGTSERRAPPPRVSRNVHTGNACKLGLIGLMRMYPGLNGKCKLRARGLLANTYIKGYDYVLLPLGRWR